METNRRFSLVLLLFVCSFARRANATVDDACSGGTGCGNNEECDTANSLNKCKCAATFINDGTGACVSKDCSSDATACSGIDNSYCDSGICVCDHLSEVSAATDATLGACIVQGCGGDPDCAHDSDNVRCDTSSGSGSCACDATYVLTDGICCLSSQKQVSGTCIEKGLDDQCSAISDCAAVTDSECSSGTCQCATGYIKEGIACKIGNGISCAGGLSDKCVSNAACSTNSLCACNSGYKDDGSNLCVTESSESSAAGVVGSVTLLLASLFIITYQ